MTDWNLVPGWSSSIGIGIFLLCLAGMIFILTKANAANKKAEIKEKVS